MAANFFLSSTPYPIRNNTQPTLLINGEEAWREVRTQIRNAQESIHLCFWAMQNSIELIRPSSTVISDKTDRINNILYRQLIRKSRNGIKVRILLWDYPLNATHDFADTLIRLSGSIGDFEVLYQEHPNLGGSWHQKTIIIDNRVAFVSGMNAKENDWDTSLHEAFDIRRAEFDRDASERTSLSRHRDPSTINPPRHDYMIKLQGDIVHDVATNFSNRWSFCIANRNNYYNHATNISLPPLISSGGSGKRSQITTTIPVYAPTISRRTDIADVYRGAIRTAERYIYIENQYFRSIPIAEAIANAITNNPSLKVIIVVPPDYWTTHSPSDRVEIGTPSSYWTHEAFEIIRQVRSDFQFHFLQTYYTNRSGVITFLPIDLHAKLMIVDDVGYTVGSCNVHDRGFFMDGELNVSIMDATTIEIRKRIFSLHFKRSCPDSFNDAYRLWQEQTRINNQAWANNRVPVSFIFSYNQGGPLIPLTNSGFV